MTAKKSCESGDATHQTLSTRELGDAVHEMAEYLDQSDVTLEYVSGNWL